MVEKPDKIYWKILGMSRGTLNGNCKTFFGGGVGPPDLNDTTPTTGPDQVVEQPEIKPPGKYPAQSKVLNKSSGLVVEYLE